MNIQYNLEDVEIAVFDLDRTLIKQDSLFEQVKVLFSSSKFDFVHSVLLLVLHGRVLFKGMVFKFNERLDNNLFSLATIRVNDLVKREFDTYKTKGTKVIVATAAYERTAIKVLQKINVVPDILVATRDGENLKGELKLEALHPHVKNVKWVYYGDSNSDIPLFKHANFAYIVKQDSIRPYENI